MLAILSRIICCALTTLFRVPESITQHASPHSVGDPLSCWILTCSHTRASKKYEQLAPLVYTKIGHHVCRALSQIDPARKNHQTTHDLKRGTSRVDTSHFIRSTNRSQLHLRVGAENKVKHEKSGAGKESSVDIPTRFIIHLPPPVTHIFTGAEKQTCA